MRGSERGTNIRAYVRECSVRYISYATVGWAVIQIRYHNNNDGHTVVRSGAGRATKAYTYLGRVRRLLARARVYALGTYA